MLHFLFELKKNKKYFLGVSVTWFQRNSDLTGAPSKNSVGGSQNSWTTTGQGGSKNNVVGLSEKSPTVKLARSVRVTFFKTIIKYRYQM